MREIKHETTASPAEVWNVLSNGWLYASWVVGASRIRAVDAGWPDTGAKIHHSVGSWPLLLNDETEVKGNEPGHLLTLLGRSRPFGEAHIEIQLSQAGAGTTIVMREDVATGPVKAVPARLRQLALVPRNRESLRRLAFLAEGGAGNG